MEKRLITRSVKKIAIWGRIRRRPFRCRLKETNIKDISWNVAIKYYLQSERVKKKSSSSCSKKNGAALTNCTGKLSLVALLNLISLTQASWGQEKSKIARGKLFNKSLFKVRKLFHNTKECSNKSILHCTLQDDAGFLQSANDAWDLVEI